MHWIAPPEKDAATETLEKRLWSAADQLRANSGLQAQEYSGPILGIIFLREFARTEGQKGGEPSEASSTTGTVARRASASDSASQFYTPSCIVRLLAEITKPNHGYILETLRLATVRRVKWRMNRAKSRCVRRRPCASTSGGRFVSSARFVADHQRQHRVWETTSACVP